MSITVTLPDGNALELPDGATGADAAAAIGPGLARAALAIEVGHPEAGERGEVRDLARALPDGARVSIITAKSGEQALELIRHDAAHVLAAAVMDLYDGVKISIGPPIADGFYYDFEFPAGTTVSEADFPRIEERMRAHIKAAESFERRDVSPAEARERFVGEQQDYKVELIDDLVSAADAANPLQTVSLYTNGPFTDLCRGPHAPSTRTVSAFRLNSVAGAYWRGDSNRTMLTRIYGTAFFSKGDLAEHLERIEQAKARDHRKLGRELDLFMFSDISPGSPFWKPAGIAVWNALSELWRHENRDRGYREVKTPILYDVELFKQSGHWDTYRDHMYFTDVEERPMGLKPMNCPAHIQIYKDARHSYRDLPIRYSEQGLVHRHEPSGTLHGLMRVRHITQDDAHIFCTEEQVQEEVVKCLRFGFFLYDLFGFEPRLELSTRPQKRIGSDEMWDRAEGALAGALDAEALSYELNPGDGAFYGPKIDLHMTDSLGRSWQLGTVQLDYSMPERFDLAYTGADNDEHRPVMIHRALMGSFERFIGILIEHYGGELPVWLAPVQAIVLPVSDRFNEYAATVRDSLLGIEARVELDDRNESIGRKIREAELRKIPYMLVVGEREQGEGTVAVRARKDAGEHRGGDGEGVPLAEFSGRLQGELYSSALKPRKSSERHA
ncbi:MAG TPA: threonine--tRNA ligase [Solirubrobacteraceae bacterium]|jgi:threonyl-tRNA synthetase|nr:threonine--tRNA ligase [Solirubrobacteraceae bacterium]